jgi:hypothetical protein
MMASHLACLGLDLPQDRWQALVNDVCEAGVKVASGNRIEYTWTDPSGARVVVEASGRRFLDLLPTLADDHPVTIEFIDGEAVDEWVALLTLRSWPTGEEYRVPVALEGRVWLERPRGSWSAGEVSLVALAEDVTLYDDRAQAARVLGVPAELLDECAPIGEWARASRLGVDPVKPHVALSGEVVAAQVRTNRMTGQKFGVLRMLAPPGDVTVCLAERQWIDPLAVGMYLSGVFRVSGRLAVPPVPLPPPSWAMFRRKPR